ncbi:MBG domain-containing protein, partial [Flavobacterium flevense]|uniref:MBG domain-containing protein n=4 Tax=Flavobacterium flevense TaxID=983 RepID=UPI001356498D
MKNFTFMLMWLLCVFSTNTNAQINPIMDSAIDFYGNNPTATTLFIGNDDVNGSGFMQGFMKFVIPAEISGTVENAKLRLYIDFIHQFPTGLDPAYIKAFGSNDDSWIESTSTVPSKDVTLGQVNVTGSGWIEIDVKSFVQSEINGDKVVSLVLNGKSDVNESYVAVYSRENATNKPELVITMGSGSSLASVTTATPSGITATEATFSGNVTADGGATVTERGFVYGAAANPTTANTKVQDDGTGTGAFTENITGLTAGTTYYVRTYAINSAGTSYGNEVSFTTLTGQFITAADIPASNEGPFTKTLSGATFNFSPAATNNYIDIQENYGFLGLYALDGNIFEGSGTTLTIDAPGYSFDMGAFKYHVSPTDPVDITITLTFINGSTDSKTYSLTGIESYKEFNSYLTSANDVVSFKLVGNAFITYNDFEITDIKPLPVNTTTTLIDFEPASGTYTGWDTKTLTIDQNGVTADFSINVVTGNVSKSTDQGWAQNGTEGVYFGTPEKETEITLSIASGNIFDLNKLQFSNQGPTGGASSNFTFATNKGSIVVAIPLDESGNLTPIDLAAHANASYFKGVSSVTITAPVNGAFFELDDIEVENLETATLSAPTVTTSAATAITATGATFSGEVTADGGATVSERGFVYATTTNPTTANTKVQDDGTGTGTFSEAITGLTAGTTYYVRAYAINSVGTSYGNEVSFTTSSAVNPSSNNALHFDSDATITNLSGISPTSFTIEFWLKSQYQSPIDNSKRYQGIYWQNSGFETGVYMDNYDVGTDYGTQTLAITPSASNATTFSAWANGVDDGDISPTQQATWRHYAITSNGTSISFYYDGVLIRTQVYDGAVLPTSNLTIGGTYGINGFTLDELRIWNFAKTQVQIQAQKDTEVSPSSSGLVRYYNFNQGTANGNNTAVTSLPELTGNGTTATLSNFTLNGSTSNWVGGPQITPIEPVSNTAPTVTTSAATAITATGATFSGEVTADGGATVSERGFVYATTTNPTTANTKVQDDATGTGTFSEAITGLTAGTTYYVRAYAINSVGTSYGSQVSFETNAPTIPLTINVNNGLTLNQGTTQFIGSGDLNISYDETFVASDITFTITSAVSHGVLFIDSNQNFLVDAGEVELIENSTFTAEEIDGERFSYKNTIANQSADSFVFKVSDPNGGELNNQTFSITINLPEVPTVTTTTASGITATGATFSGEVTADGGASVTERGFVYGTAANPTTANTKVQDGTGTGTFTENITGLTAETTYYVRAYAINSAGTSYGSQVSFTTSTPDLTLSSTATDNTISSGTSVTFTATPSGTSATKYLWKKNGMVIPGATNATYTTSDLVNGDIIGVELSADTGSIVNSNLVLHLNAGDQSSYSGSGTTWTDISTNNNNVTLPPTLATSYSSITGAGSFNFQGNSNTTIQSSAVNNWNITSNNALSVETWVKRTNSGHQFWFSTPNLHYRLGVDPSGNLFWDMGHYADRNSGILVSESVWHHIVYTAGIESGNITTRVYLDGAEVATQNEGISTLSSITNYLIGDGQTAGQHPLKGDMGLIRVYNKTLSSSEVTQNYNAEIDRFTTAVLSSNSLMMTVNAIPAVVTTTTVSDITATGATFSSNVTADGGASVTERGFVYGTAANPTTSNTKVQDGTGTGTFSETINGLTAGTTYYVRTYAINSVGTSYGNEVSFTTSGEAVNDAPLISGLPTTLTFTEDQQEAELNLTGISFSDTDAGSNEITVTLNASSGIFNLAAGTGVTLSGQLTANPNFTGTLSDLNTYFNIPSNIWYVPTANANGTNAATITLTVNDNGNTGTGGAKSTEGTININITAVNDAPSATALAINGTPNVGQILTGIYTYNDVENDTESGSTFKWYRSDDNAGLNKAAIANATSNSYTLVTADGGKYISFEVTPRDGTDFGSAVESTRHLVKIPITVTADASQTKVYGTANPVYTYTVSPALVSGDTFTGALTRDAGENIGNYAITQGTLSAGSNYTINYVSKDFAITAKPITVTVDAAQTKVYGENDPTLTYTVTPSLVNSDVFTGTLTRDAGENIGNYAITQGTLSAGTNYNITYVAKDFTITAKPITVIADASQTKVYGENDPTLTYTVTPSLVNSDVFTGTLTRDAGENIGNYAITQGTLSAGSNYTISYVSKDFTITAKPITVIADASQTKVYGENDPTLTYTVTPSLVNSDVFTGTLTRDAGENIGNYAITQGTLSAGSNYTISYVSKDFAITAKPITVTADEAQTKVYGENDPTLTYTVTPSLVNSDVFTGTLTRTAGENIGNYTITQGTLSAGSNYTISYVTKNFAITAKPITVTADALQTKVYGTANPVYTYSVSPALISGDTFTGALTRTAGENIGNYAITQGTLSAGSNYTISYVSKDFAVTAKPITVTADASQTKVYGTANPVYTYSVSPALISGDTFTGALTRTAGENIGNYAITQGTLSAGSNYTISYVSKDFAVTAKPITVTADASQTKVYGTANPVYTYTVSPALVSGDTFTGALTRTAGENIGNYAITQGTLSAGSNYTISYVSKDFAVTAKPITVTADALQTKVYGENDPTLTYTVTPSLVNSDVFTGTLTRTAGENIGNYTITQGTLSAGSNYTISYVSKDFAITAKPITVTADAAQTKVYGENDPTLTYTVTPSLVNSDVFTGTLTRTAGENIGNYAITQGTLSAGSNYTISYVSKDFTITAKPITVTADASQTKVYGTANPVYTYSVSPALISGDTFTGALTRTAGENIGNYAITQGTLSAGSNYTISYASTDFAITAKPITVTADASQTKVYGTANPVYTYTVSPALVSGDTFTGALTRDAGENVGSYAITQGTLSAGINYIITYTGANFSITKADQIITWNQSLGLGCDGETSLVLTAVSNSGLAVNYTSSNTNVATISNDVVNFENYGSATITASQEGTINYNAAPEVVLPVVNSQPNLIRKQFEDVIFFDNSSKNFMSYSWYKDGVLVPGQTSQYFKENGALNGTYYTIATKLDGTLITTCPLTLSPTVEEEYIKIAPN